MWLRELSALSMRINADDLYELKAVLAQASSQLAMPKVRKPLSQLIRKFKP
jgi:hypothetical protein